MAYVLVEAKNVSKGVTTLVKLSVICDIQVLSRTLDIGIKNMGGYKLDAAHK
jgi:hypothetical protein